ncbi:flavin reductase family protein [Gordonia sp. C13]|uniref:flavin reductase family protein n=1 Tax=Gordonia sp. C13 TaxID=2935078 RepID=UPI0024A6E2F3|nr:flavin reductase family protein [Gordonia sp. C13]
MELVDPLGQEQALRRVYGLVPSGVLVLAATVSGVRVGMSVSSFSTVSLNPALLAVNIRRESSTWPTLTEAQHIGVSLLAHGQGEIGRQLAGNNRESRFDGVAHVAEDSGAVYIKGAVAWMETTHRDSVDAGDHTIELLHLIRTAATPSSDPLVFHRSRFATLVRP